MCVYVRACVRGKLVENKYTRRQMIFVGISDFCTHTHAHTHIYIYMCVYIYIYIYIYIYMHIENKPIDTLDNSCYIRIRHFFTHS